MPVSHRHSQIFVHIPKAAGTSIEKALKIYGFRNKGRLEPPDLDMLFGLHQKRYLQHLTLAEIHEKMGERCSDYFSFSFVRNPFDRVVSQYAWRKRIGRLDEGCGFEQFLLQEVLPKKGDREGASIIFEDQHKFVAYDNGQLAVDFLGRFETLERDFDQLSRMHSLRVKLPRLNVSPHRHYSKYYSARSRALVEDLYQRDLELFDYCFEEKA